MHAPRDTPLSPLRQQPRSMSAAAAAWAPQADGLQTIVQLLTEYRQPGVNQAEARQRGRRLRLDAAPR